MKTLSEDQICLMELSDFFSKEGDGDRDAILCLGVFYHLGESGKVSFEKKK